jgi:hypothetical protein
MNLPDLYSNIAKNYQGAGSYDYGNLGDLYSNISTNYYNSLQPQTPTADLSSPVQSPVSQIQGLTQQVDPEQIYKELEAGYGLAGLQKKDIQFTPNLNMLAGVDQTSGAPEGFNSWEDYTAKVTEDQKSNWIKQNQNDLLNNLIYGTKSGETFSLKDVLGPTYRSTEVIPDNPVQSLIGEQFNSVYGTNLNQNYQQQLGKSLGLSQDEIDRVARLKMADLYQTGLENSSEPFNVGATPLTSDFTNSLYDYANRKYGTTLDRNAALQGAQKADQQFKTAREIQGHQGGFMQDIAPVLQIASMAVPGMQAFMPYVNAAMAAANGNIGGAALSMLGAPGMPLANLSGTLASNLGISQTAGNILSSVGKSGLNQLFATGKISPENLLMAGASSGLNSMFKGK